MGRRDEKVKILNITLTVTPIQSWTPNQMKGDNTAMNMAMGHSYEKCKNEFVKLIFTKTSFSKTNLLVEFSKYK